jgi:hypothetical protein
MIVRLYDIFSCPKVSAGTLQFVETPPMTAE